MVTIRRQPIKDTKLKFAGKNRNLRTIRYYWYGSLEAIDG